MTQPVQAATGDVAPQPLVIAPFRWTAAEIWSAGWGTLPRGRRLVVGWMMAGVPLVLGLAPLAAADRDRPGLATRVLDQAVLGAAFALVLAIAIAVLVLPRTVRAGSRGVACWVLTSGGIAVQGSTPGVLPWARFGEVVVAAAAVRLRREAQPPLMFPRRVLGEAGTAAVVAWAQSAGAGVTWRCAPLDAVPGPHVLAPVPAPTAPEQQSVAPVVVRDVTAGYGDYLRYRWVEADPGAVAIRGVSALIYFLGGVVMAAVQLANGNLVGAVFGIFPIALAVTIATWVSGAVLRLSQEPATIVADAHGIRTARGSRVAFVPWTSVNRLRAGRRLLALRTRGGTGLIPLRFVSEDELSRLLGWARAAGTPVVEEGIAGRVLRPAGADDAPEGSEIGAPSSEPDHDDGDGESSASAPSGDFAGVHVAWTVPAPGQRALNRFANRRDRLQNLAVVSAAASLAFLATRSLTMAVVAVAGGALVYEVLLIIAAGRLRGEVGLDAGPTGLMLQGVRGASSYPWTEITRLDLRRSLLALRHVTGRRPLVLPRQVFTEAQVAHLVELAREAGVPVRGR